MFSGKSGAMFIQIEDTPNPQTLKFLPGQVVADSGTHDFSSPAKAEKSPLALRLFEIDGVQRVFLGHDFISVTKDVTQDWYALKPLVLGALLEHFVAKRPILDTQEIIEHTVEQTDASLSQEDQAIVGEIMELLDARIRPAVAMDGGDITFVKFEGGTVYLALKGACSGCPSSTATLKQGIESMLQFYIPEVKSVEAMNTEQ